MNSLYQQLEPTQQLQKQPQASQNNLKAFFKTLSNNSNPQQLIQNILKSNPKLQNIMNIFQGSRMSPKQFFYHYAQQQGVNPEEFLNSLK